MTDRADQDQDDARRDRIELVSTILLAVAAVLTAWSSYQANRWNGAQARASGRTNALRIEASTEAARADAETEIDVATFIAWSDARLEADDDRQAFYVERFRSEFKPAFDAWVETDPFVSADAPPTPFAMPEYRLESAEEAERLNLEAEVSAANVARNIQRSASYVLGVLLFTVSLFFAGMSTKLQSRANRKALLVTGCLIFIATAFWIATLPKQFAPS